MSIKTLSTVRCFGGVLHRVSHTSVSTKTDMVFAVFLPAQAETAKVPALFYLSGLTCTDENFMQKAGWVAPCLCWQSVAPVSILHALDCVMLS